MQIFIQVLILLGALAMFLYGMLLMSEGMQKAAGDSLRSILNSMTSTPFKGIVTGILVTALIQSSSATTVMLVSMVNAGLMSLSNAIGVIMGANIGTTVTAWLITLFGFSYDISTIAIPFIALGFALMLSKSGRTKSVGQFIIGFALLFIGLATMKDSVPDLKQYPEALAFVQQLTGYKFFSIIIFTLLGTVLTVILQSSSAAMALTMLIVANGWINFEMASAMVLGENIGTTVTALLAAMVGNYSAKRTAVAHTLFNVIGVVLSLIFFNPLLRLIGGMVEMVGLPDPVSAFDDPSVIAAGSLSFELQKSVLFGLSFLHTVFNVLNTLILVAFIPQIVKIVTKIIPTPKGVEEVFRLRFIQGGPLSTAELSLDQAKQEIIHFAEICHRETTLIRNAIEAMNSEKFDEANAKLARYEQITDSVEYEIASYLNGVSKGEISAVSVIRIREMYRIIGEMESIGDSAEAIGRILKRARDHGKAFSEDMLKKLNRMLDLLDVAFEAMIENVTIPSVFLKDISNAQDAEYNINEYRNTLREEHILNIEKPDYDYQTGVFFTNIVQELEKMGDFIINVSECQLEKGD